jgi:hypothetical protein
MKLSVSQLKKYISNKAERAWTYVLGIREYEDSSSTIAGSMFHCLMEWKEYDKVIPEDLKEEVNEKLNALKENYKYAPKLEWQFREEYIEFNYMNQPCVAICDMINKEQWFIVDYKSAYTLSKVWDYTPSMFSKLWTYWDYEVQAWFYMLATWISNVKIIEVCNKVFKTKKPEEHHQVIEFNWDEEFMKRMSTKFNPIIEQLLSDYLKFNWK